MLSKKDIAQLDTRYPSEAEFHQRFDEISDKFDQKFAAMRNDILQFKDDILTEIKAMREEIAALLYRQIEHTDQIENLDQRVTKLEKKPIH